MQFKLHIALALASEVLLPPISALAADYDPPIYVDQAPEYQPVEVGSGWYLRGDVGYNFNKPYKYFENSAAFSSSTNPVSGSVGIGYHLTDYLRAELNLGLLPKSEFSTDFLSSCEGTQTTTTVIRNPGVEDSVFVDSRRVSQNCQGQNAGTNSAFDGTANLFVDLGTFAGVTPYIGGGLGLIYSRYRSSTGDRHCTEPSPTVIQGGNVTTTTAFRCDDASTYEGSADAEKQLGLIYSLNAGFAYQVSKNVELDFGYEYKSAPSARYVSFDNNAVVLNKGIDYHQFKVGVRYDLW